MSQIKEETKNPLLNNGNDVGAIYNKEIKDEIQFTKNKEVDKTKSIPNKNGSLTAATGKKSNGKVMKKVIVKDEKVETELVPPDGGWGWLILFGSMLVNILVPGTVKSFGVLFVDFLEVFEASPAAAAWIPALCYFLYSSLGPLSSILSVKYSYRTVTLLGGTFAAVGMILSFWAQSVDYLYVSYGLMVGTGAGLSFPPTVYIVMSYFVRLRGVANGLCISGSAIGSIILPPLLRYLLETYGYRGAVLIMGGITLNVWVGAMFYHPVEKHMKRVPKQIKDEEDLLELEEEDEDEEDDDEINNEKAEFIINPDDDHATNANNDTINKTFTRSASSAAVQNYKNPVSPVSTRERKISMPMGKEMPRNKSHTTLKSQMHSTPSLVSKTSGNKSLAFYSHSRLPNSRQRQQSGAGARLPRRSPSTSSFQYVSTPYHGSTLSALHPEEFASSLTLRSLSTTLNPVTSCCKGATDDTKQNNSTNNNNNKHKYLDITLLRDPLYLVILISNSTNAISYTNFIIFLPSYAIALGFDKSMAAWLISIVSALDLVGRLGGSALSDTGFIPKTWYFVGGLLVSGIALALLPLADSYTSLAAFCGVFGLASGVYVGVTAVIMADMLGTERLTSSYGISLFVNGILQLAGPPLCGAWLQQITPEQMHNNPAVNYNSLLSILGIVLIVGAALWGVVPFIKRKDQGNGRDELLA